MSEKNPKVLNPHPLISKPSTLLICVLDGWGEDSNHQDEYNAIAMAKTPTLDALKATAEDRRWRLIKAHGTAVGLPSDADMGNSEVGHNALGAGQIVDQGAKCVDHALATGTVWQHEGWSYISPAATCQTLHLIGLLSDGGVHSRYDQLLLLINGAVQRGVKKVRLHVLSDGRDVEDFTADKWIERLQQDIAGITASFPDADIKIASGGGRMKVTMDRYNSDWNIVKRGWEAHILGEAPHRFTEDSLVQSIRTIQVKNDGTTISDQNLDPWVVIDPNNNNQPIGRIVDGDAVVTFNFRADRMIEICQAFEDENFTAFDRARWPKVKFAGMMVYDNETQLPRHYLVPPPVIENASEEYLVATGLKVFACSESQKIGHVTFFWNGNRSGKIAENQETFLEIPSDQGISFDQKPAMQANEIAAATKEAILSGKYDVVRCNFPNGDMVGHTGNLEASIECCSIVDTCVKELLNAIDSVNGRFILTADHGNVEDMAKRDKNGQVLKDSKGNVIPLTSHTLNPVPCAIGGKGLPDGVRFRQDLKGAGLANVTATYINLLGYEAPDFYEPSLIDVEK